MCLMGMMVDIMVNIMIDIVINIVIQIMVGVYSGMSIKIVGRIKRSAFMEIRMSIDMRIRVSVSVRIPSACNPDRIQQKQQSRQTERQKKEKVPPGEDIGHYNKNSIVRMPRVSNGKNQFHHQDTKSTKNHKAS